MCASTSSRVTPSLQWQGYGRAIPLEEVDARPSDAIALAVLTGCPIYVAEQVISAAGLEVPEELNGQEPRGRGIDAIVKSHLESWEGRHDLIAHVFGSGE